MNANHLRRALLATTCLVVGAAGCELLTDFDRTQIPGGGFDGSVDSPGLDVTPQPIPDAQQDVARDAPVEAAVDAADATTSDAGDATTSDASDAAADADDASDGADADDSG